MVLGQLHRGWSAGRGSGTITSRPGRAAGLQGVRQCLLIDGRAPAHVDHIGGGRQQGDPLTGQDARRLRRGGQGHDQKVRRGKDGVQLVDRQDAAEGRFPGLSAAAYAGDGGPKCLHPPGGMGPDVPRPQHDHMAAVDGPDGGMVGPLPPGQGRQILRHPPQEHQGKHDDMLGDGGAVGPGGVG